MWGGDRAIVAGPLKKELFCGFPRLPEHMSSQIGVIWITQYTLQHNQYENEATHFYFKSEKLQYKFTAVM